MNGFMGLNQSVAIDLGTATTKVYLRGKGILIDEPTVVALDRAGGEIVAIGEAARRMLGRTPGGLEVVRPIENGVISEYSIIEKMLRHYLNRVCGKLRIFKPPVMISVPAMMTDVEARAVVDAALSAGAQQVYLICEPVAAAIGCGRDISRPHGILVVDVGGGTTDIAVITLSGVSAAHSIRVAGNRFDEDIIKFINRRYQLLIGIPTAQHIKETICSAMPDSPLKTTTVKGRNYVTGMPQALEIDSRSVTDAIAESVSRLSQAVGEVLASTPPELVTDIKTDGILLSGGGSLIEGLDRYLADRLNTPVVRAERPSDSVILGTAAALEHLNRLTPGAGGYQNNLY